jgi:hypothetical protein
MAFLLVSGIENPVAAIESSPYNEAMRQMTDIEVRT